jgi:hypothetical protein|tara:strand:+ start:53 stop:631 length:579 start_codon:yes stop_codon:yes gene_type:complete
MADKVRFGVSVTPIEDVGASSQGSTSNFIAASECFGSAGGEGQVGGANTDGDKLTGITIVSGGGANDGYTDGVKYYLSATQAAESSAVLVTDLAAVGLVYFKHTGFEYSSTSALSTTANTTDLLAIQTNSASNERVTIARLYAGEAIVLPVRLGCTLNEFAICASDGVAIDGTASTQGTIGVEFMAFAATGP